MFNHLIDKSDVGCLQTGFAFEDGKQSAFIGVPISFAGAIAIQKELPFFLKINKVIIF